MKRRTFVKQGAVAGLAATLPVYPSYLSAGPENRFGVAEAGYMMRMYRDIPSTAYPPFKNSLEFIDHCVALGFGGVQVSVRNWDRDTVKQVRQRQEASGFFVEGSIRMPANSGDTDRFENELKMGKEAGMAIFRTVCLSGRRYETFKTLEEFTKFREDSLASIRLAEPIARKNGVKLAIENHKDWRADEFLKILTDFDSEWLGVNLDTGNNISLLERPMDVVDALAPYTLTVHIKDMGVEEYEDGFLLSEVNLGEGYLDIQGMIDRIRKTDPNIRFNLEMITRDPLQIPCLTEGYWETFDPMTATEFAGFMHHIRTNAADKPLPRVSGLSNDEQLALEIANNKDSLEIARKQFGFS